MKEGERAPNRLSPKAMEAVGAARHTENKGPAPTKQTKGDAGRVRHTHAPRKREKNRKGCLSVSKGSSKTEEVAFCESYVPVNSRKEA